MILLETSQSVANRLEHTCLENNGPEIKKELSGLPYVRVRLAGASQSVTSSLIEAHRLNSPFIISDAGFKDTFVKLAEYGKNKPLDWNKMSRAIFYFDPNSLLHGLFMANLEDGRIKSPRALTGFIEAEDIREAASGGVKNNPLDPSGTMRAEGFESNVYGKRSIPSDGVHGRTHHGLFQHGPRPAQGLWIAQRGDRPPDPFGFV